MILGGMMPVGPDTPTRPRSPLERPDVTVEAQFGQYAVAFAGELLTCHISVSGGSAAATLGACVIQVVGRASVDSTVRFFHRRSSVLVTHRTSAR